MSIEENDEFVAPQLRHRLHVPTKCDQSMTSENNSSQDTSRLMQFSPPPLISSRTKPDHQKYTLKQQSFVQQIKHLKKKDGLQSSSSSSKNIKDYRKTHKIEKKAKCEVTVIGYENMEHYESRDADRANEMKEKGTKDDEISKNKSSNDLITPYIVSRNSLSLSTEEMQKEGAEYFRKSAYRSFEVAISS